MDLAEKADMKTPISILKLMKRLDPETVIFDIGKLAAASVDGTGKLAINSAGFWSFTGNVVENGHAAHNYALTIALTFKDPTGNNVVVAHEGKVYGTFAIGDRESSWQDDGYNLLIANFWDDIKYSGTESHLHVSTEAWGALEVALAVIFLTPFVVLPSGGGNCTWTSYDPSNPLNRSPPNIYDPSIHTAVEVNCVDDPQK